MAFQGKNTRFEGRLAQIGGPVGRRTGGRGRWGGAAGAWHRMLAWVGVVAALGCAPNPDGRGQGGAVERVARPDAGYVGAAVGVAPEGVSPRGPEVDPQWHAGPIRWTETPEGTAAGTDEKTDGAGAEAGSGGDEEDTLAEPPTADAEPDAQDPDAREPDARDPDALDPDEVGVIEPWPMVADCSELQATACISNYTCAPGHRCEPVGAPDDPVRCCLPGERSDRLAGVTCEATGVDDCLSGLCLPDGEENRCSRRCVDAADCPYGLRLCTPFPDVDDHSSWCQADGASGCVPPGPGDLIINEIMVFAERPERPNEFIELVNTTGQALALSDLTLRSNRGAGMAERVAFAGGCLAAGARLAVFESGHDWRWSTPPADPPVYTVRPFGFSNTADVRVELAHRDGTLLDTAEAAVGLLRRGVSLNRSPDATAGAPLVPHDQLGLAGASPAASP